MGAETCCKRCFGWFPVVFITAIIAWSYYAYVFQLCILTVPNTAEKVIYLIIYHPLLIVFMWAYGRTIFVKHAHIPEKFFVSDSEHEAYVQATDDTAKKAAIENRGKNLPIFTFTKENGYRYCEKCKCIKPDRCHHCSMCDRCILKMDHHCPWVNACVGYSNYKFFILFLGYAELYCLYVAATTGQYFVKFWTDGGFSSGNFGQFHILFLFFVSFMFAISLTALFGYHIYLTVNNKSTLESFRAPVLRSGPDKSAFFLGKGLNFRQVFGNKPALWFIPIFSSAGDGVSYPLRASLQNSANYEAVGHSSRNGEVNGRVAGYTVETETSSRSKHSKGRSGRASSSYHRVV